MKIGINCGHTVSGTVGSGAVGYINESDETRKVGYKLEEYLKERGVDVLDCTDDYSASVSENLGKIVSMANFEPLDLFVSVHFNSGGGKGCEVFTYNGEKLSEAESVCENMARLGFVNRGIKNGSSLYVIRKSVAKAMLIEVCFVDTKSDTDLYEKIGAENIARAIGDAIIGENLREDITMSQYEELKNMLSEQSQAVEALQKSINKIENPMIYNYIDENMPSWAREAVGWCVENGIIAGTGDGLSLDDTRLWVCVVIFRLAKML